MTIQQGQCTVFKQNCLSGLENFAAGTSYVYKIALYTASADLSYSTTAYTTSNEISGTGYTAGGETVLDFGNDKTTTGTFTITFPTADATSAIIRFS